MSELSINISGLPEGAHQRSLKARPEEIGLDQRFTKELVVEAALEKTSRQLFVHIELKTGGRFCCDRCLEDFEREVASEFGILYVNETDEGNADNDEVQVLSPDTNIIDLGEDVRQYALLALPPKVLCSEDCAGLCPTCGANLNRSKCSCVHDEVDSRWSGLQKFIKN